MNTSIQTTQHTNRIAAAMVMASATVMTSNAMAATANDEAFAELYTFFANAATGNLTRGICLLGGIIGAGTAAINGKILLAATGIGIAIFGMLSPKIIGSLFGSAILF